MTIDIEKLRAANSTAQPPFKLKKLGQVVIKVTDLQRSLAFYAGVLGFKVSDIIGDDGIARPPHEWRGAKSIEEALKNPPRGQTPVLQDSSLLNQKH